MLITFRTYVIPLRDQDAYPKNVSSLDSSSQYPIERITSHDRLAYQARVVLRLGIMLLASGASSYRVKDAMQALGRAVGIDEVHAQVTYTEIVATFYANGTFRTELAEQRIMGVNADRIDHLNRFVKHLPERMTVEEAEEALDVLERRPHLYNRWIVALASGIACAAFAFLNKGGVVECSAVAVAAFFGQLLRSKLMPKRMNHFGVWMACGALASSIYILIVGLLQYYGIVAPNHQAGFISAILFLVPGFPLVTSIIDLVRQDFTAGISRATYVFMLVVSAAIAVWCVSLVFSWPVTVGYVYHLPVPILYPLRAITTAVAAFGFAMLFNTPPLCAFYASLSAAAVNMVRLAAVDAGFPNQLAVGLSALAVGLIAWFLAGRTAFSRVPLSVPAVVIMIPGTALYRALASLNNGQISASIEAIFQAVFVITSIGVGLGVARMITDPKWLMEAPRLLPSLGQSYVHFDKRTGITVPAPGMVPGSED